MPRMGAAGPRATIVVSLRERWALTEAALDGIVANTPLPYRLVLLDAGAPAWLRDVLAQRAREWNLEVIRCDGATWPQEARARFVAERLPETEFTVFIDNDVDVTPGWLDALLACADETGAGIVGPLYLWGDGIAAPRIHMAGGRLVERAVPGGRTYDESHQLFDTELARHEATLTRSRCGFLEYHCMLVRTALLREPGIVDAGIRAVHEHIDLCLEVRKRGHETWWEPRARVNYLAFADYTLEDLPVLRVRWAADEVERSIARFCARQDCIDDPEAFAGIRRFAHSHVADIDPLREGLRVDRASAMQAAELAQTRSALLDQALACGYDAAALRWLDEAWRLAQLLLDGGYRPCGRPFVNHLVGTASVLLRYGFRIELVVAGLLHAVYSHCPAHPGGPHAAIAQISSALGGVGSPVEKRVRAYTLRDSRRLVAGEEPFVDDAELLALVAANELDMLLSGELRHSGRPDAISEALVATIARTCDVLGAPGLARALHEARAREARFEAPLPTRMHASYRISADKQRIEALVSDVPRLLEPAT